MARKDITPKLRFSVLSRDLYTCQYCGAHAPDVRLEIDHIVPVSKGGTNDIGNLITSCEECNYGKGSSELGVFELATIKARMLVREIADKI